MAPFFFSLHCIALLHNHLPGTWQHDKVSMFHGHEVITLVFFAEFRAQGTLMVVGVVVFALCFSFSEKYYITDYFFFFCSHEDPAVSSRRSSLCVLGY